MEKLSEYEELEIFKYLDVESLKQCAKSKKRWAGMIGGNTRLMNKLPLEIHSNWWAHKNELLNLKRTYNSILLNSFNVNMFAFCETFNHNLAVIKSVEMKNVRFSQFGFSKFLNTTPNLQKLVIRENIRLTMFQLKSFGPPSDLKSLQSLELESGDWGYLSALVNTQVKKLEFNCIDRDPHCENQIDNDDGSSHFEFYCGIERQVFKNFFESQENLESLTLAPAPLSLISYLSSFQCKYKLKKLTLDFGRHGMTRERVLNLISFLEHHKLSLEYLNVNRVTDSLIAFIWKNLQLKELIVTGQKQQLQAPKWLIIANHHLKTLRFGKVSCPNTKFMLKLIDIYPAIERLTIDQLCSHKVHKVFEAFCSQLKSIRHLTVPKLIANPKNTLAISVPSLKTLQVRELASLKAGEQYFIDFNGIEKLAIENVKVPSFVKLIMPDVKHLKVGIYQGMVRSDFIELGEHCPKLRLLEAFDCASDYQHEEFRGNFNVIHYKSCHKKDDSRECSYQLDVALPNKHLMDHFE